MVNRQDGHWDAPDLGGADAALPSEEADLDTDALRASALRQARRLVEFYRITPQELLDAHDPARRTSASDTVPPPRPVKYRHPLTGETWDGEGQHPSWMRQALLHDGYRVEELKAHPVLEEQHARPAA